MKTFLMGLSRNYSKIYMQSNGEELGSKFYESALGVFNPGFIWIWVILC